MAAPERRPADAGLMLPHHARRRSLLLAGAAAGATLAGGCAGFPVPPRLAVQPIAPPPKIPPSPHPYVGALWRYEVLDGYNGNRRALVDARVADAAPDGALRVLLTHADGRPRGEERHAGAWRVLVDPSWGAPSPRFADPVRWLPDPLAPSGSARTRTHYTIEGWSGAWFWDDWLDAHGWERVTVPAGTFDCLRVDRRIAFRSTDPFRIDSWRNERQWYSPAVQRFVRRSWRGQYRVAGRKTPTLLEEEREVWALVSWQAG